MSSDEVERLRRLLAAAGREDAARQSDVRMLRDLRLFADDELTRAGLLLVGSETAIARAVPTYGYAYQYRPSPGSEATARLRERRPLLVSIERVLDARKISCRTPSTPRNRLLLETVTVLQIAERTGQGVDRAYRDLLRIGKQPPRFDDDGTG